MLGEYYVQLILFSVLMAAALSYNKFYRHSSKSIFWNSFINRRTTLCNFSKKRFTDTFIFIETENAISFILSEGGKVRFIDIVLVEESKGFETFANILSEKTFLLSEIRINFGELFFIFSTKLFCSHCCSSVRNESHRISVFSFS